MKCQGRLCVSRHGFVPSRRDCAANELQQAEQAPSPQTGYTTTTAGSRDDGDVSSREVQGELSSSEPRQRRQQSGLSRSEIPIVAQDIPISVRRAVHIMVPRTCLMFVPNRPELLIGNHRDREGPISQYTNRPPSVAFDSGDLQRRWECHTPRRGDMTAASLRLMTLVPLGSIDTETCPQSRSCAGNLGGESCIMGENRSGYQESAF